MIKTIPMFPLSILPLPGEIIPLYIFEPRYRELLLDAETEDISFGIFFNNIINVEKIGSLVKLESILKKHPEGESDIIVKCHDIFTMDKLYRTYKSKLYPGGDVNFWETEMKEPVSEKLDEFFRQYLVKRNILKQESSFSPYEIAVELNFDLSDRYDFLLTDSKSREGFLIQRIKYQIHLMQQEDLSKDLFHLN